MSSFADLKDVVGRGQYEDPVSCLDAFHAAAAAADLSAYFGCFLNESSRFLGTDGAENWTAGEFYNYSAPHFRSGKGWTYLPRKESRKIDVIYNEAVEATGTVFGAFATFDEILDHATFGTCRGSGTLTYSLQKKSWLIVAYHLSFPTPNEIATEICATIAKFEQGKKLSNASAASEQAAAELLAQLDLEKEGKAKSKKGGGKKK